MKTLKYWDNAGGSFLDYVHAGDEIDGAMFWYFLGVVPPAVQDCGYFLMGEPSGHTPEGEALYMKFTEGLDGYHYAGLYTTSGKPQGGLNG